VSAYFERANATLSASFSRFLDTKQRSLGRKFEPEKQACQYCIFHYLNR